MEVISINWGLLGAKLANSSDIEQAEFFKGFAFDMNKYESSYAQALQLRCVYSKLSKREQTVLKNCLSMLWDE